MKTNMQPYEQSDITIEKASNAFLGIRSLGLFAPLSYWRSQDDWGIGDLDVFLKVVEFAKQMHVSILSLLPLNIPLYDNCPYANASIFVFDPVYIGLNMLLEFLDIKNTSSFAGIQDLMSSLSPEIVRLRGNITSTNEEIRKLKYKIFLMIYNCFKVAELKNETIKIMDYLLGGSEELSLKSESAHARMFKEYVDSNRWISDYVLFFILAKNYNNNDFRLWPEEVSVRSPDAILALKEKHKDEILFEIFLQWILTEQLRFINNKASEGQFKVDIMLDQPFAFGNADVWCNLTAFLLDPQTLKRECTQGCPPHRLDIPQHWNFYILDMKSPAAKSLLLKRLLFLLQFADMLRIDHALGYYQIYYITEDDNCEMSLEKMGIWSDIYEVYHSDSSVKEKRERIYEIIVKGIKEKFPKNIVFQAFDEYGNLEQSNVILAARKTEKTDQYNPQLHGWYSQNSFEEIDGFIYTLLSVNEISNVDYLEKIIKKKDMFLTASDCIRIGFFKAGIGEEILSLFLQAAEEQGKGLVFESLGVVPNKVASSMYELGLTELKPLFFGYRHFIGDYNDYWFDRITFNCHVSFSTHDTITIRGFWEGKEKWSREKYYFKNEHQKQAVVDYLVHHGYLNENEDVTLEQLNRNLLRAILRSVADSEARDAVIMMPNILGSGDEGIINMPGYTGFWTARAPIIIENLLKEANNPSDGEDISVESEAVALIQDLVRHKKRDSFKKQAHSKDPDIPYILSTFPMMREGSKQICFMGESFLVDVVVFGKCNDVSIVFENREKVIMKKVVVKRGLLPGLKVFRAYILVDERMVGVNPFQIELNGISNPELGYLIGLPQGLNLNPLSKNYCQRI